MSLKTGSLSKDVSGMNNHQLYISLSGVYEMNAKIPQIKTYVIINKNALPRLNFDRNKDKINTNKKNIIIKKIKSIIFKVVVSSF